MEQEQLEKFRDWFDGYVAGFYGDDEFVNANLKLKEEHSRRTCEEMRYLACELGLSGNQKRIAEVIAILHDVGRFEQFVKYRTYNDPRSVNPFSQEIQMTWTCKRNAWQNPQVFGDLFFVDRTKKGRISIKGRHAFIDGSFFFRWASGRSAGMKTASAN